MDYGYNIFSKSILISVGRILSVAHESEGVSVGLASVILYKKLKTRGIEMLNSGVVGFCFVYERNLFLFSQTDSVFK